MQEVHIRKISVGTVFKLVGTGLMLSLFPFVVLAGCTAALGLNSLMWNGQPLHGWTALVAAPFIGLFMVALFTASLGSAIAFGLWVYSWFGPFPIAYQPADPAEPDQPPAQPGERSASGGVFCRCRRKTGVRATRTNGVRFTSAGKGVGDIF